eukprot:6192066-Pleurochrysis_carterae.AAC.1
MHDGDAQQRLRGCDGLIEHGWHGQCTSQPRRSSRRSAQHVRLLHEAECRQEVRLPVVRGQSCNVDDVSGHSVGLSVLAKRVGGVVL